MTKRKSRAPDGDSCPQTPAGARDAGPGHGAKSEAIRERAIAALLSEKTLTGAARRCGVNEKTLRRWMSEESFSHELTEARRAMFEAGMRRVQALTAVAIDTLATLMGRGSPPAVRLGAARTVAELGIHQHDADTILRKLDEIEAGQREQDSARRG